jgi:hypothetical protein
MLQLWLSRPYSQDGAPVIKSFAIAWDSEISRS